MRRKLGVVMGGATGIGRGIALALAREGHDVCIADLDPAAASKVAGELTALGVETLALGCDVTDSDAVEAVAERCWQRFGQVDYVFNNAGVYIMKPALDYTPEDLRWVFEVNVNGTWNGCLTFGRRFVRHGVKGRICNTASVNALGMSSVQSALYTATKHAVLGFSDVLRHEYAEHFAVSVLCPGAVNTGFWDSERNRQTQFGNAGTSSDFARRAMRYGLDPEEVGRLTLKGVDDGEFLIFSSPMEREIAQQRWLDIDGAFARQWPNGPLAQHRSSAEIQALVLEELRNEAR